MRYSVESLTLLLALEDYIPFMTKEELLTILWYGRKPSDAEICTWELKRQVREQALERRFKKALTGQK